VVSVELVGVEVVLVEVEELVLGVVVVSVEETLLLAVVSVDVVITATGSPNAPEAIRPNANATTSTKPILTDRCRNVRRTFFVPCCALSLMSLRRLSGHDRPQRQA
jgi:hypothetical protein